MVNTIRIPTEQGEGRKERFIWHMLVEDHRSNCLVSVTSTECIETKISCSSIIETNTFPDTSIEVTIYRKQKTEKVKSGEGAETAKGKRRSEGMLRMQLLLKRKARPMQNSLRLEEGREVGRHRGLNSAAGVISEARTKRGTNATVILDRVSARKLIEMERIKIGWIYCPVRERVWKISA
nr:unnamed protein product [Callosobruchus chinensis]